MNKILNDKELEEVNGGANVGGVCGFNDITIGDISGTLTSETDTKKPDAPVVGCYIGLPAFP